MKMIKAFSGKLDFCSNFYLCEIEYKNIVFSSSEHAFQWAKCKHQKDRFAILDTKIKTRPDKAKRIGRQAELIDNWDNLKYNIMKEILYCKFQQNPELSNKLINTNNEELIEYNSWHDNIWGICTCNKCGEKGTNWLGKILMEIRDSIKNANY